MCIDDLAGAAPSGMSFREHLDRLLDAGITVIATMHVGDAVDESVLAAVDDIELVDLPVSILRERLRAGVIVEPQRIEPAMQSEFSEERLSHLREQAFRMVAWHADQQQVLHLRRQGEAAQWEARPRVMACVSSRPGMERLIRRAAGLAASLDTDFRAVTVRTGGEPTGNADLQERYAALASQLGGQVVALDGAAVAPALAQYARENLVTELLITRGSRGARRPSTTIRELTRMLSEVDIHILSAE